MLSFRLPQRKHRHFAQESLKQKLVRLLLLLALFGALVYGLLLNNERRMEMLRKPGAARPAHSFITPAHTPFPYPVALFFA